MLKSADTVLVQSRRLQLTIITGFLGSGKTTLIGRFLRREGSKNTGVIVNEFGAIGIDDLVLTSSVENGDRVQLLRNGCICCTAGDDLSRTIRQLHRRLNEQADLTAPMRLIVETSGLADPLPLVQKLILDLEVRPLITFSGVVAVVDAVNGAADLRSHAILSKQIAVSDRVVISKTDIVSEKERVETELLVRQRNTVAVIHQGSGALNYADLLDSRLVQGSRPSDHFTGQLRSFHRAGEGSFASASVRSERAVNWDRFMTKIDGFIACNWSHLMRIKGLLQVEGRKGPTLVNGVGVVFNRPVELPAWPGVERGSALVAITNGRSEHLSEDLRAVLD